LHIKTESAQNAIRAQGVAPTGMGAAGTNRDRGTRGIMGAVCLPEWMSIAWAWLWFFLCVPVNSYQVLSTGYWILDTGY